MNFSSESLETMPSSSRVTPGQDEPEVRTPQSFPPLTTPSPRSSPNRLKHRRGKELNSSPMALDMPFVNGNFFTVMSTFCLYPIQVANQKKFADQLNHLSDKSYKIDFDRRADLSEGGVIELFRSKGLSALYRGFPAFMLHELSQQAVRQIAKEILLHLRHFLRDPETDILGINAFHTALLEWLNDAMKPTQKTKKETPTANAASTDLDEEENPQSAKSSRPGETLVMKWIHDRPSQEDSEEEDDLIRDEILNLAAELLSELVCYPLLLIAQRQMVVEDQAGYSMASMFNVSQLMDGGYGWLYRGIEYRISKLCLRTAGRIAIDLVWDRVDNIIDNGPMREASKILLNQCLSPLEILSNLEKARSNVPGLVDDDATTTDMLIVSTSTTYRWMMASIVLAIPVGLGLKTYLDRQK